MMLTPHGCRKRGNNLFWIWGGSSPEVSRGRWLRLRLLNEKKQQSILSNKWSERLISGIEVLFLTADRIPKSWMLKKLLRSSTATRLNKWCDSHRNLRVFMQPNRKCRNWKRLLHHYFESSLGVTFLRRIDTDRCLRGFGQRVRCLKLSGFLVERPWMSLDRCCANWKPYPYPGFYRHW